MTQLNEQRSIVTIGVPSLTELLREAEDRHGFYEPTAPKHHWSDWYAAYMIARKRGRTIEEAEQAAGAHMQAVLAQASSSLRVAKREVSEGAQSRP